MGRLQRRRRWRMPRAPALRARSSSLSLEWLLPAVVRDLEEFAVVEGVDRAVGHVLGNAEDTGLDHPCEQPHLLLTPIFRLPAYLEEDCCRPVHGEGRTGLTGQIPREGVEITCDSAQERRGARAATACVGTKAEVCGECIPAGLRLIQQRPGRIRRVSVGPQRWIVE